MRRDLVQLVKGLGGVASSSVHQWRQCDQPPSQQDEQETTSIEVEGHRWSAAPKGRAMPFQDFAFETTRLNKIRWPWKRASCKKCEVPPPTKSGNFLERP